MSNWISKATGTFKGDDSSSPQAFELICECGQKHSGMRRAKWQRIICRSCGGPLFVVQKDPYPIPKEMPQQSSARAGLTEATVEDVDETANARTATAPPRSRRESAPAGGAQKRFVPSANAPPARKSRASTGGFWKQFRIIMGVIGLVAMLTGYLVYQSAQRTHAERSLKDAIDKIHDAFLRSEWVEARNQLEVAVQSLDYLGREGPDTTRYRQQLRETVAMTGLVTQPLGDILEEAAKAQTEGEKSLQEFQYRIQGQWLILDGQAKPELEGGKSSLKRYVIPLPITVGEEGQPVQIVIESRDFARMMSKTESETEGVVVAIQIASISPSEDKSTWEIIAVPESTVLWTDQTTYRGIGFSAEEADAHANTLARQAEVLGVTGETHAP